MINKHNLHRWLIAIAVFGAGFFTACEKETDYEDRISNLEQRVSALEQIVAAQKTGDVITSVTPIMDNGVLVGYHITFGIMDPIDVFFGKDGKDGNDGKDGDSMFESVTVTDVEVTFVTADGKTFVVKRAEGLTIEFDSADLVVMAANATRGIHYTISSISDDITIEAWGAGDVKAKVEKTNAKTGVINVKTGAMIDEYSKVVVLVSNGIQTIMRTLNFEEEAIEVGENTTKAVSASGGEVMLEFFSNVECHAVIPEEAQNWISVVPATKGMTKQTITLAVEPNTGAARSATITIRSDDGSFSLPYVIDQPSSNDYIHILERGALIAIYNALDGDNWKNKENWCSDKPLDTWYGVTTDDNGFVERLELRNNNLKGGLPEQLWELVHLYDLTLTDNSITGGFPKGNNSKCELGTIDLARNKMSGDLSALKGLNNLSTLFLNENAFSGPIPKELTEIKNIRILYLWKNAFQGSIPAEFGNCKKLRRLNLCYNYLSGEIPEAIGNAPELTSFPIYYNCFTGKYPQWLLDDERFRNAWLENIEGNLFDLSDSEIPGPVFDFQTLDGNHVTSDIYGNSRYTILFRTCDNLFLSEMKDVFIKYHNSGVDILGLYDGWNMPDDVYMAGEEAIIEFVTEQAKQHQAENNIPWTCCINRPVLFNPLIFIIDKNGRVIFYLNSFMYPEDVPLSVYWPKWNLFLRLLDEELNTNYSSSDYSHDGEVKQLQVASKGQGIDLVLMGDGYSDRLIEDGTYDAAMQRAAEALLIEEPFKSYRDLFNIYSVTVVSDNEEFGQYDETALESMINENMISANNGRIVSYVMKAIPDERIDEATVLVVVNQDTYAGTCYMYSDGVGDYGRGLSIGLIPAAGDIDAFNGLVAHEACGHGFAKLADEYGYEANGEYKPYSGIFTTRTVDEYLACGWYKNIDFTGDPARVKWNQFISDPLYASENIGCYEGGLTYWTGVWRPTENSIMRDNTGGFNAPSRYAIWYRIGKLAYGESWNGTYEDFVAYDAINRTPAAVQKRQAQNQRRLPPLAPPVVIDHSWRDAK